jgi:lysophospholipase L1-like esterase
MNLLQLPGRIDRISPFMKMHRHWFNRMALCGGLLLFIAELMAGAGIDLRDGDRVAFLGGTIFDRDRLYGELETALVSHFRGREILFRNLGWDGDTVFGHARAGGRRGSVFGDAAEGFIKLKEHVERIDPTVVFLGYGGTEAHDGTKAVAAFEAGINHLLDALAAPHRRFVLLTPLRVLAEGVPRRVMASHQADLLNVRLKQYRDVIIGVGAQRAVNVIDLFNSSELLESEGRVNGLHLSQDGYRALARYLVQTECQQMEETKTLNVSQRKELQTLVQRKNELFYNWWRPRNDAFVFGERKSEQVPVQLELPQYPDLIANLELSIQEISK